MGNLNLVEFKDELWNIPLSSVTIREQLSQYKLRYIEIDKNNYKIPISGTLKGDEQCIPSLIRLLNKTTNIFSSQKTFTKKYLDFYSEEVWRDFCDITIGQRE